MKHSCLLYSLVLFLLSISAHAQSGIDHRLTASLSRAIIDFPINYKTRVLLASGGSHGSSIRAAIDSPGIGMGIGYQGRFHHRWEVAARFNYLGNTINENQDRFATRNYLSPEAERELDYSRKYRALWFEGLLFWRVIGPYSKADIQLGSGISFMYHKHFYLQGYIYNSGLGFFDLKTFAEEKKSHFGIPLHFQIQYPVSPVAKLGVNTHANIYFNDNLLVGMMVFGAYRW